MSAFRPDVDQSSHAAELIAVRELAKDCEGFDPLLYWETRAGELRRELEELKRRWRSTQWSTSSRDYLQPVIDRALGS